MEFEAIEFHRIPIKPQTFTQCWVMFGNTNHGCNYYIKYLCCYVMQIIYYYIYHNHYYVYFNITLLCYFRYHLLSLLWLLNLHG